MITRLKRLFERRNPHAGYLIYEFTPQADMTAVELAEILCLLCPPHGRPVIASEVHVKPELLPRLPEAFFRNYSFTGRYVE